jgi:hypothetical protein
MGVTADETIGVRGPRFSFRRLALLLRREAVLSWRGAAIAAASVAAFVIVVSLLSAAGGNLGPIHDGIFTVILFLGGWITGSLVFRELRHPAQSIAYLTLPGSALEKLLGKLLLSSVGYAVGVAVLYAVVAAVSEGVNALVVGVGHPLFDPVSVPVLEQLAIFVVTQSMFFLGSLWFRRSAFVKTWLAIVVYWIVFVTLAAIVARVLSANLPWQGFGLQFGRPFQFGPGAVQQQALLARMHPFVLAFKILFWAALAPVCWVTSWLRLREAEA